MGALAAIAVPRFASYKETARLDLATADIPKIDLAIRRDKAETGNWPAKIGALNLIHLPTHPWGRAYVYLKIEGAAMFIVAQAREDQFLVPLNAD